MGKKGLKYDSELPSYFYSVCAHHELAMQLLKKAQNLEEKIKKGNTSVEISLRRLEKASEIYRTLDHMIYFENYVKYFSMKEIDAVYEGIRRTTIFDYEPLCFIRE
jgi:hypothetical protein